MTKTEKTKLRKWVLTLAKKNTYKETAKILARSGVKTPLGRKPTISFVNNVVSGNSLKA